MGGRTAVLTMAVGQQTRDLAIRWASGTREASVRWSQLYGIALPTTLQHRPAT